MLRRVPRATCDSGCLPPPFPANLLGCALGGLRHSPRSFFALTLLQPSYPGGFLMVVRRAEKRTRQTGRLERLHFSLHCAQMVLRLGGPEVFGISLQLPCALKCSLCRLHPSQPPEVALIRLHLSEQGLPFLPGGFRKPHVGVSRIFSPQCLPSHPPSGAPGVQAEGLEEGFGGL